METTRPRIEGDREQELLDATLDVLSEVGYDRLTMDAVAARAKASKATLYRRWSGKVQLVMDALHSTHKAPSPDVVDTGSLRGDLIEAFCGMGGLSDPRANATLGAVLTAVHSDPEFAEAFRAHVLASKIAVAQTIWQRAKTRGELRDDLDLELIAPALPGILLHRKFMLGEQPTPESVINVIDQIIVPAAIKR